MKIVENHYDIMRAAIEDLSSDILSEINAKESAENFIQIHLSPQTETTNSEKVSLFKELSHQALDLAREQSMNISIESDEQTNGTITLVTPFILAYRHNELVRLSLPELFLEADTIYVSVQAETLQFVFYFNLCTPPVDSFW